MTFKAIQAPIKQIKVMNVHEPPKRATSSAIRCPNVIFRSIVPEHPMPCILDA